MDDIKNLSKQQTGTDVNKTISGEDICSNCGHERKFHIKSGCHHGCWGNSKSYPCLCIKFTQNSAKMKK